MYSRIFYPIALLRNRSEGISISPLQQSDRETRLTMADKARLLKKAFGDRATHPFGDLIEYRDHEFRIIARWLCTFQGHQTASFGKYLFGGG